MRDTFVPREQLDPLGQSPVLFDALIAEGDGTLVFCKTLIPEDPGVAGQRVTPGWPHHLPGDLIIALTGQAGVIALRRSGVIDASWRGHGVRIREARFSAPVFVGETFYTRVEIGRIRRLAQSLHVHFAFRMWKADLDGNERETFRSEQDAIFFPAGE
jgi:hypothetical protein